VEDQKSAQVPVLGGGEAGGLSLLRATEAAAMAAGRLFGRADPDNVKEVGWAAMLHSLEESGLRVRVVLGGGGAGPMESGHVIGAGPGPELALAAYPVEGASLVGRGLPNAISIAVGLTRGAFPALPPVAYVEKVVAGPLSRGAIDLDDTLTDNLRRIAFARDSRVSDLTIAILDRPRHKEIIDEVRAAGARILSLEDGDIAGALTAASEGTGIDALVGIGGVTEAVMAAAAVSCLGGEMQARLWPRNDEERELAGDQLGRSYSLPDLAPPDVIVAVTGITGGALLKRVLYGGRTAETMSLLMSGRLGTVRRISTRHLLPA
jgi:fructose-1,6-bisphosphatase II